MARRPKTDPTKAPRLDLKALGDYGVNVVESPLHLKAGELVVAQNVERSRDQGIGGLRKRLGIGLFTVDALLGPVLAIIPVPLPNPIIASDAETFWLDGLPSGDVGEGGDETFWMDGLANTAGGEP